MGWLPRSRRPSAESRAQPAALVINVLGIVFGYRGWKDASPNPGSRLGLILNALPVGVFFGGFLLGIFRMVFGDR